MGGLQQLCITSCIQGEITPYDWLLWVHGWHPMGLLVVQVNDPHHCFSGSAGKPAPLVLRLLHTWRLVCAHLRMRCLQFWHAPCLLWVSRCEGQHAVVRQRRIRGVAYCNGCCGKKK